LASWRRIAAADVALPYYATPLGLAQHVDTLIVVTPGGAGTANLVDAKVLSALGPDGILVNISRGSVVDQAALIEALQNKRILAAGLDVFTDEPRVPPELVAMDNVVLTPHIGSSSLRTWQDMSQVVLDNLVAWFREGHALTPV
jgi:lactate dehydrogenase-like 2-hydroxyacid dehydrogenase